MRKRQGFADNGQGSVFNQQDACLALQMLVFNAFGWQLRTKLRYLSFWRRDKSRLYKVGWYGETMAFIINVCACRDADLSRLEIRKRAKTCKKLKFLPAFVFCFEKICTFVVGFKTMKSNGKDYRKRERIG